MRTETSVGTLTDKEARAMSGLRAIYDAFAFGEARAAVPDETFEYLYSLTGGGRTRGAIVIENGHELKDGERTVMDIATLLGEPEANTALRQAAQNYKEKMALPPGAR